ncbi:MAG: hypothetical protein RLN76_00530 [Phycisphaeraceae bacterium]
MKPSLLLALLTAATLLTGCAATPTAPATPKERILHHYGYDNWDQITGIAFDFKVQRPNGDIMTRSWLWNTAEHYAVLNPGDPDSVLIDLNHPDRTDQTKQAHGRFINDTYWLLFPFQLEWSEPTLEDRGLAEAPEGAEAEMTELLVASYPQGGYTPGDAYELYVTPEGRIAAWVFVRNDNRRPAIWNNQANAGPIKLNLNFVGPNGFHLWFDNTRIRLQGERFWRTIEAE